MNQAGRVSAPEPLGSGHVVQGFRCGDEELDTWLVKHALQAQGAGSSRTVVICSDRRVVGFHSLAAGSVAPEEAPERILKGMGAHRFPVVVLTRLAVDQAAQSSGLGTVLLRDALARVAHVAETIGVRAVMVQAKDDSAKAWYLGRGAFVESRGDPLVIYLLLKDIRASLAVAR